MGLEACNSGGAAGRGDLGHGALSPLRRDAADRAGGSRDAQAFAQLNVGYVPACPCAKRADSADARSSDPDAANP